MPGSEKLVTAVVIPTYASIIGTCKLSPLISLSTRVSVEYYLFIYLNSSKTYLQSCTPYKGVLRSG